MELIAKLPAESVWNGRMLDPHKEEVGRWHVVAWDARARSRERGSSRTHGGSQGFAFPVKVLWWMGRSQTASRVYCSVWIRGRDGLGSWAGHGCAGGYGYCKRSAAFAEALDRAGVELADEEGRSTYIAGVGEGAVRAAMLACAKAAGYGRCPLSMVE